MKRFELGPARRIALGGILLFVAVLNAPHAFSSATSTVDDEGRHKHLQSEDDVRSSETEWARVESQLASLDSEMFFSCGRNALYMFMHSLGHSAISFEEVKAAVPLSAPAGASLKSILDAAGKLGVDAEVRLYNQKDYDSVPLPAIFHMRRSGQAMAAAHYDVMYKKDAERVYLINGTTARPYTMRRTKFGAEYWTGYALIEKRSIFALVIDKCWPALAACFLVIDIVLFAIWIREVKRAVLQSNRQVNPQVLV